MGDHRKLDRMYDLYWQLTAALLHKAERIDIFGSTVRRVKDDMHVLTYLTARIS